LAAFFADGGGGVDAGDLEFAGFHGTVCFAFFGFEGCFGAGGFFFEAVGVELVLVVSIMVWMVVVVLMGVRGESERTRERERERESER
jgi:hypothetical protein